MEKSSIIKKISDDKADVVLFRVPYESTVSGGDGAAKGPEAIVKMLNYQLEEWDFLLKENICDKVKIVENEIKVAGLNPYEMTKTVEKKSIDYFEKRKFIAALGGEHTISIGIISAAKKVFKDLTILQIDAHADLRDDNSDYENNPKKITKYAHSCVMRRVYELGCPIVQIGIRSLSSVEDEFIKKEKIGKNIFYAPVKDDYKKIISKCTSKKIYITIDVDSFDPAVMPATGTPEPGGLLWDWVISFLHKVFSQKDVIGFDIVEVAPRKDNYLTEFSAAKLLYHLIGLKFLGQKHEN